MSAIVEAVGAFLRYRPDRCAVCLYPRAAHPDGHDFSLDEPSPGFVAGMLSAAGRAITSASQAAASGNVITGAPRTWAVRWLSRSGRAIAIVDGADATCFGTDERETYDYRRRKAFRCRPCWDATARAWRWGSPACDPRGCAWPRPWVGGEVRRG